MNTWSLPGHVDQHQLEHYFIGLCWNVWVCKTETGLTVLVQWWRKPKCCAAGRWCAFSQGHAALVIQFLWCGDGCNLTPGLHYTERMTESFCCTVDCCCFSLLALADLCCIGSLDAFSHCLLKEQLLTNPLTVLQSTVCSLHQPAQLKTGSRHVAINWYHRLSRQCTGAFHSLFSVRVLRANQRTGCSDLQPRC